MVPDGAVKLMPNVFAPTLLARYVNAVGGSGSVNLVTEVVESIELPEEFLAFNVIVYVVFDVRPVTVKGDVVPVPLPLLGT
jgi:hypothetical protein